MLILNRTREARSLFPKFPSFHKEGWCERSERRGGYLVTTPVRSTHLFEMPAQRSAHTFFPYSACTGIFTSNVCVEQNPSALLQKKYFSFPGTSYFPALAAVTPTFSVGRST